MTRVCLVPRAESGVELVEQGWIHFMHGKHRQKFKIDYGEI
jgi:hypothetical protein